jgi:hypothetical protein
MFGRILFASKTRSTEKRVPDGALLLYIREMPDSELLPETVFPSRRYARIVYVSKIRA